MDAREKTDALIARAQDLAGTDVLVTAETRLDRLNLSDEEDFWELAEAIGHDPDHLDLVFPEQDAAASRRYASLAFLAPFLPAARRLLDDQPELDEPTLASFVASLEAGHHVPSGQTSRIWQAWTAAGGLVSGLTSVAFLLVLPSALQFLPCDSACSDCSASAFKATLIRSISFGLFAWLAVTTCLPGLVAIHRARGAKTVPVPG